MPANVDDLQMKVQVSRTLLGLDPLELNDYLNYYVGTPFLGGQERWERDLVNSRFIDGDFEASARLQGVDEPVTVEILGVNNAKIAAARAAVLAAFAQARYTLTVTTGFGFAVVYDCRRADRAPEFTGPRLMARQNKITFTVPRRPHPVSGG